MFGYIDSVFVFFFKQKTAYEMRISDWSSDVCSSDLSRSRWRGCRRRASACSATGGQGEAHLCIAKAFARLPEHLVGGDAQIVDGQRRMAARHRTVDREIGRASCRERGGQYGEIPVVAVA